VSSTRTPNKISAACNPGGLGTSSASSIKSVNQKLQFNQQTSENTNNLSGSKKKKSISSKNPVLDTSKDHSEINDSYYAKNSPGKVSVCSSTNANHTQSQSRSRSNNKRSSHGGGQNISGNALGGS
jgi:hypothetical protein